MADALEYPVRTERLALRPFRPADADAIAGYRGNPEVCRYVPFTPQTAADIVKSFSRPVVVTDLTDEGEAMFLVVEAAGHVVGDVMLAWSSREHRSAEIGYVFHPDVAGRGYATEAAAALLPIAFDRLDLHRVVARVDARNDPSAAVLRRLGFRQEAHLVENEWFKGEWTDELDFAMLAAEWRAGRAGTVEP